MIDFRASNLFRTELMFNWPIISRFTLDTLIPLNILKGSESSFLFSLESKNEVSTSEKEFSKELILEENIDLLLSEAFSLSLDRILSFSKKYSFLSGMGDKTCSGVPMLMGGGGSPRRGEKYDLEEVETGQHWDLIQS